MSARPKALVVFAPLLLCARAAAEDAPALAAADVRSTRAEVWLAELLDEIVDDAVALIAQLPKATVSPLAIRTITLGSNVAPSMRTKVAGTIVSALRAGTEIRLIECLECRSTRAEVIGDRFVMRRGVVGAEQSKRVAKEIGAGAFLDVAFGFDRDRGVVEMDWQIVRADDATIVWADSLRVDGETAIVHRMSESPKTRLARLAELERILAGKPTFGYSVGLGFGIVPYDDAENGDITGVTLAWRIFERFGADGRVLFGLDLMGFLSPERLAGGILSAGSWWVPLRPDPSSPELRVGLKAGALLVGNQGNAACFQAGAELLLRYRFGVYGYAMFFTSSEFDSRDIGGLGANAGVSFNW
ncbi:MAG: hypothetical protein HYV07_06355 [Deltaproteobacteria bacterium]|nr:hypothetical protein [Deltaproteobacteria bacterium]